MIYSRQSTAARPRVTARLLSAATYPISVLIAPAGFGKTTAVRGLLEQFEETIYVVTPQAATLDQFMRVFARACAFHFPEMESPPHDSISETQSVDGTIELYLAWAQFHLRQAKCTIAIDDLQFADGDCSVATFLSRLADSLKSQIKWVFCSRTRGTLPLTRWQAYGDSDAPVTADDLRLTLEEARALAKSLESPADAEQIKTWVEQTHGFPVPLAYAIRLSARRGTVENIMDGARAVTFSFLAEQLWTSLPVKERYLLEVAAFLPPTHMHAIERSGIADAAPIISKLCADIAFLDLSSSGTFTIHDLFRDFIRQHLTLKGATVYQDRIKTAASILLSSGSYNEGFELLLESGNVDDLVDSIERYPPTTCDLTVTRSIVAATAHLKPAQLGLELLFLQTEHWSWLGEAHKSYERALAIIDRPSASSALLLCATRSTFKIVNFEGAEEHKRWLKLMPPLFPRLDEADRAQARAYQASLLARYPETLDDARDLIRQVQAELYLLSPIARVHALIAIGSALYYLGESDAALRAAREAATVASSTNDTREAARALNNYGLMLYHAYDPEVETLFTPLADAVERTGSWRFALVSHWLPPHYYALQGDILKSTAAQERQQAIVVSEQPLKHQLLSARRQSANMCKLIAEDYAAIIADFNLLGIPQENDAAYEALAILASVHAFTSNFEECSEALRRLKQLRLSLPTFQLHGVRESLFIEVIATCAIGRWAQGKRLNEQYRGHIHGLAPLEATLSLFCQGPPFVNVKGPVEALIGKPFFGLPTLLMTRVMERELEYHSDPLTPAEKDVLRLLGLGNSNKEIASLRKRSEQTIKRQVAYVYRKLGVENRTRAVAVARERGLL